MKNRVSQSSDRRTRHIVSKATALILLIAVTAAAYFLLTKPPKGLLILENPEDKTRYAEYEMKIGDTFSIEFIHSVNKSPVTDYFEIQDDGIYGVKQFITDSVPVFLPSWKKDRLWNMEMTEA